MSPSSSEVRISQNHEAIRQKEVAIRMKSNKYIFEEVGILLIFFLVSTKI